MDEFPSNVQLASVGLAPELYIPPPVATQSAWTEFPVNVQLLNVASPVLYIPPPKARADPLAEFSTKAQSVSISESPPLDRPPPKA